MPTKSRLASLDQLHPLAPREVVILTLLSTSNSGYAEVADLLGISVSDLRTHVRAIYRKLKVGSRREARAVAEQMGVTTKEC